jgi:hypothetical protein
MYPLLVNRYYEDCITLPGIKQYYRWFVKFPFDLCRIVGVMVSMLVGIKQQSLTHSFDLYTEMNNHSSEGCREFFEVASDFKCYYRFHMIGTTMFHAFWKLHTMPY